jgi:hypothetical protein
LCVWLKKFPIHISTTRPEYGLQNLGIVGGRFIHLVVEIPDEEDSHTEHEGNATNAHDSVVGGKKIGKQFHDWLLVGDQCLLHQVKLIDNYQSEKFRRFYLGRV